MKSEEQIAQLKKEKAEVECQLQVALRRIMELEGQLRRQEETFEERLSTERKVLQEQLEQATSQIEELKVRLSKDSHNSHKPPKSRWSWTEKSQQKEAR
jgi:chromosome segregation ATPase